MRRVILTAVVAAAPLGLAVVGLVHPHALNPDTAGTWRTMHIWLLAVFPLVALGFVLPLWGRVRLDLTGIATVAAWVAAFVYGCFYTGLDAVAGIGAGTAALAAPPGTDLGPVVTPLFQTGDQLGHVGAVAFMVASAAATAALAPRHGLPALAAGALLVGAGYSFIDSHIFWPRGVVTMTAFAIGFGVWGWITASLGGPDRDRPAPAVTTSTRRRPT